MAEKAINSEGLKTALEKVDERIVTAEGGMIGALDEMGGNIATELDAIKEQMGLSNLLTALSIVANQEGAQVWMGTYKQYLELDREAEGNKLYVIY